MDTKIKALDRESPAHRLGILYVASLSAVALLTAASQGFILREVAWQSCTLHAIGLSDRQRALDRSLSVSALELPAASDVESRRAARESLRQAIAQRERERLAPSSGKAGGKGPRSRLAALLIGAERHRLASLDAARALLARFEAPGTPPADAIGPLTRTILAEEEQFHRAVGDAVYQVEQEAIRRIDGLESLQFKLFGFVLVVLLLEGLFVLGPAVRKIQHFMEDMRRSHEELKLYAARLERSNKELEDFASVASHDLQEPLRKVLAFSDRLRSRCGPAIDDQGRDYLDRVQNAARRMQTLINDLLTYARVTTKAQPFTPIDLGDATRAVLSDLEARIEQVGGQVDVGALPTVDADPVQVRQLMQNLIGNALKYHRAEVPPRVKVYSRPANGDAPATAAARGDRCEILVEDNGIGFEEVYRERIFGIFQRLHGRNEYEGTGVGLAVCRKIVERHGGAISARSTPGEGSTFTVTLPVRQPREASPDGGFEPTDRDPDRRR